MKRFCINLLAWIALTLVPGFLSAGELRVLVSFNASEHVVKKVLYVGSSQTDRSDSQATQLSAKKAKQLAQLRSRLVTNSHSAVVTWLGQNDEILLQDNLADPRAAHAPLANARQPEYFLRTEGVYLLVGPAHAARLTLFLPEFVLDGYQVPAEHLELDLTASR